MATTISLRYAYITQLCPLSAFYVSGAILGMGLTRSVVLEGVHSNRGERGISADKIMIVKHATKKYWRVWAVSAGAIREASWGK